MALGRIVDPPRRGLLRAEPDVVTLADRARDERQWERAARLYRKALNQNPLNPPIWVQYGHALKESGELRDPEKLAQAEVAYRTALSLDPGVADTYLQLGHVLKLQGKTEEAQAAHLRAFATDPATPYPLRELRELGWSEAEVVELLRLQDLDDETLRPLTGRNSDLIERIFKSGLFDASWYIAEYDEVSATGVDPLLHYLSLGAANGHDPHPLFDSDWYLANNPDVAEVGVNPLAHYLQSGAAEGRDPHPLFDSDWYLANNPEVAEAGLNPLAHYLRWGAVEGRDPHPLFDSDWYLANNPDVAEVGVNPLAHYLQSGAAEARDPHPLFDSHWYFTKNPDVAEAGVNPLVHYVSSGASEGRQPRPADRSSRECGVLDIPFEIWRSPPSLVDRDVCLFVTYSPGGRIENHVLQYLKSLVAEQFSVVLVIATEGIDHILPPELEIVDGILVRASHGWDFAAWAAALAIFPDLWCAHNLILANDSIYGPIDSYAFKSVAQRVRSSEASVVALTDSYEYRHHLQSYFIALKKSALTDPAIRKFWVGVRSAKVRNSEDKWEKIVYRYELPLIEHLRDHDIHYEVLFPTVETGEKPAANPTLAGWRDLVSRGFPFLKVNLLRNNPMQADLTGWEYCVKDAQLLGYIQAHLAAFRNYAAAEPVHWPVPSPRRRFKRNSTLQASDGVILASRPTDATDLALEVPFRYSLDRESTNPPERVAVIVHLFYSYMSKQFFEKISNIPVSADLFISTDTEDKRNEVQTVFNNYRNGAVQIRIFPNIGRDIAAMLVGYADVLPNYDIILHIHSKESPHDRQMTGWRDFLLNNLLGSPDVVRSILDLFRTTDVGVIFSQHFPAARPLLNFGFNFQAMKDLLARFSLCLTSDLVLEFPSGSFFWARTRAIKPLFDLHLDWSAFPPEPFPVDGTLAHAIERSILYLCESTGHRWAKVARNADGIPTATLVPVCQQSDIGTAVSRVNRWMIGNPVKPIAPRVPEINLLSTKFDPTKQPRLNLIVPDLQPQNFYGGLTTAVDLFRNLERHLGSAFDYRIISSYGAVDLASMLRFPEYRLLPLGTIFDHYPRTVVDAGDCESGELSIRVGDIFIATAWWTACTAFDLQAAQKRRHGRSNPIIYFIQDHEPDFYGWSSRYAAAQQTYTSSAEKIAIINSEELTQYMVGRYGLDDVYTFPFVINPVIREAIEPTLRERIIVIYGRPGVPRNCFDTIIQALLRWQRLEPCEASRWQILSAGEDFSSRWFLEVKNLTVLGKLSLEDYGKLLGRASVGISLMMSPHPSYPPLEMASSGLVTITNKFEGKDVARRSPNVISVSCISADAVADALSLAVRQANTFVGTLRGISEIAALPTAGRIYDAAEFALRLSHIVGI
jgi:lipopolysaccharide biosynthesis protein